ncbi:branched-chain amino acid ABC transporter permease [Papillibacter cinnamivorans]|uniref:Amino acid/amide ABC transporter membrane protein 1, HAAT family n=1 Tax=Papillibacter cinnamivorans DSM 12816 TaxID=1122930 RepID=A0A1W2C2V0_9FIRM|nr:branched-chain amino acid ABC transporter permease [Papillibacter cinnamivorans]SMC79509.1 amino acid/amide ABC transporter membrane protein 1, HAAT family [Papillibacter cinnamivorans DSM 12816]
MSNFIQILFSSLEIGSVYALAALGIIIIFRTSQLINFAQGSLGMFSAYIAAFFIQGGESSLEVQVMKHSTIIAVLVGMLAAFLMGVIIDFLVVRRAKKQTSPLALPIITLGIVMMLTGLAPIVFGGNPLAFPRFIENASVSILGVTIMVNSIVCIILGFMVLAAVFLFLQNTVWGLAVRTTASNETTARLMGVPTKIVTMVAWAVAAALGALSALILAPSTVVDIVMMDGVQLNAFIACVLGGFQTFYGPVIGAYILALTKNIFGFYISTTWGTAINYVLILIFIVIRPYGLFGKKTVKKV